MKSYIFHVFTCMGPGSVFNTTFRLCGGQCQGHTSLDVGFLGLGLTRSHQRCHREKILMATLGDEKTWRLLGYPGYIVHGDIMETFGKMVSIDGKLIYCKTVKFLGIESLKVIAAQRHGRLDLPSAKECKKSFAQHGGPRAGCKPRDPSVLKTCHPVILQIFTPQMFSTV